MAQQLAYRLFQTLSTLTVILVFASIGFMFTNLLFAGFLALVFSCASGGGAAALVVWADEEGWEWENDRPAPSTKAPE